MKKQINEQVTVTSMGFRKGFVAYPKRIEFNGDSYSFIDTGLRCLIRCGETVAEILTLSDGVSSFKMRSDNDGRNWTLISIAS